MSTDAATDATKVNPLSSQELRIAVAKEVMGLWVYHYDKDVAENCYYMLVDTHLDPVAERYDAERQTEDEAWRDVPAYECDAKAALAILPRIAELNRKVAFVAALAVIKGVKQPFNALEAFELLNAEPEEIAAAALAAVRAS